MRVILDRVAIKPDPVVTETKSGIYLPENAAEKQYRGTVVALGEGQETRAGMIQPLKIGDRVVYSKYGGVEIKDGGEQYLVIGLSDILAIVDEETL